MSDILWDSTVDDTPRYAVEVCFHPDDTCPEWGAHSFYNDPNEAIESAKELFATYGRQVEFRVRDTRPE